MDFLLEIQVQYVLRKKIDRDTFVQKKYYFKPKPYFIFEKFPDFFKDQNVFKI